jgi:hypothetical protein
MTAGLGGFCNRDDGDGDADGSSELNLGMLRRCVRPRPRPRPPPAAGAGTWIRVVDILMRLTGADCQKLLRQVNTKITITNKITEGPHRYNDNRLPHSVGCYS